MNPTLNLIFTYFEHILKLLWIYCLQFTFEPIRKLNWKNLETALKLHCNNFENTLNLLRKYSQTTFNLHWTTFNLLRIYLKPNLSLEPNMNLELTTKLLSNYFESRTYFELTLDFEATLNLKLIDYKNYF